MIKINSLEIEYFRGLRNIKAIDFNHVNLIVAPGNFGKTSFLQAIVTAMNYDNGNQILYTANMFKKTKCKDYDMLERLLCKHNNFWGYSVGAVFNDYVVKKELRGAFLNKNKKFIGEYSAEIRNFTRNLNNTERNKIEFKREDNIEYTNSRMFFPKISYFDFENCCECSLNDIKNAELKIFAISFLNHFGMKIQNIFIKNRKYMVRQRELGDITVDFLGSIAEKCIKFINFCDKNQPEVMLIENADCMCNEISNNIFAEFILAVSFELKCQVFITSKSREFAVKIAENAEKCNSRKFINILDFKREDEKITITEG